MSSNATIGTSARQNIASGSKSAKSLPIIKSYKSTSPSRPKSSSNRTTSNEPPKNPTTQHRHGSNPCLNEITKLSPMESIPADLSFQDNHHDHQSRPDAIKRYLDDRTHSNPGYSYTYTNGIICTYGFPTDEREREELEKAIVAEAKEKAKRESQGNTIGKK